jgi:hypothetical protein
MHRLETRNPKPETRNPKFEIRMQATEGDAGASSLAYFRLARDDGIPAGLLTLHPTCHRLLK